MHAATLSPDAQRERAAYSERIGARNMTPLWEVLHALVPPQPRPQAQAAIWRYAELREQVLERRKWVREQKPLALRVPRARAQAGCA